MQPWAWGSAWIRRGRRRCCTQSRTPPSGQGASTGEWTGACCGKSLLPGTASSFRGAKMSPWALHAQVVHCQRAHGFPVGSIPWVLQPRQVFVSLNAQCPGSRNSLESASCTETGGSYRGALKLCPVRSAESAQRMLTECSGIAQRVLRDCSGIAQKLLREWGVPCDLPCRCSRGGVKHLAADVAEIEEESTAASTVVTEQGDRIQAR